MVDILYPFAVQPLSEEDGGGYLAFAPDLRGCVGDGATPEEAIADLRSAIAEWCDEALRLNRKIPKPYSATRKHIKERKDLLRLVNAQREVIKAQNEIVQSAEADLDEIKRRLDFLENTENCDLEEPAVWTGGVALFAGISKSAKRRKTNDLAH